MEDQERSDPPISYDVEVMLDKKRTLRLTWRALMDFERETKLLVSEVLDKGQLGFFTVAGFVWAGLRWQDRGLTLDRTAAMLQRWAENGGSLPELWHSIQEALQRSKLVTFEKPEEKKAEGANGAAKEGEGDDQEDPDDPMRRPASGSA